MIKTNRKKIKVIESGLTLFAKKGYEFTSIQEIATESNISKGAFYLHFKSKEELLLSIFKYNHENMKAQITAVDKLNMDPREKFKQQILVQLKQIAEHKDFIIMHFREQAVAMNEDIHRYMRKMQMEMKTWYEDTLMEIYGSEAAPYLYDLSLLLDGIRTIFVKLMIVSQIPLDIERLPAYILKRMDHLVDGILLEGGPPLMEETMVKAYFSDHSSCADDVLREIVANMKDQLDILGMDEEDYDLHLKAIDYLKRCLEQKAPDRFSIQGVLANLKKVSELKPYCKEIAQHLKIQIV
ncbi:TetR/AcrR family transcriptional regulator [Fictibacillus sp. NRS-1165]|uniref:TetR/AcrR family transcriptional regulator n=1 Tax=Fictibacillus sp. NRS-1165 TaxID=3144463 RepID=UPI003D1EE368